MILAVAAISVGQASPPNGCLGGSVQDAVTGNVITEGTVSLLGLCEGSGCSGSPFGTTAEIDSIGRWVTDSYASQPEDVTPSNAVETVAIIYDVPGYHQAIVFHTPSYSTNSSGEKYSVVQLMPLAPDTDVDVDGDGLYSTQEAYFGTLDLPVDSEPDGIIDSVDSDGDGISDYAEVFGENFIDLPGMGADPLVPDVFVEIDCLETYCPTAQQIADIEAVYDSAPIPINVHAIVDDEIPSTEYDDDLLDYGEFVALKDDFFSTYRKPYFRYNIWTASQPDRGGISYNEGFVVEYTFSQEYIFVHELGHQLGLGHGGHNNVNCKPNYLSVMNYLYAYDLKRDGQIVIDYSRLDNGDLHEGDLDEPFGLPLGSATPSELSRYAVSVGEPVWDCGSERELSNDATTPLDWNDDGDTTDYNVSLEFLFDNQAGPGFHTSESQNDWENLSYISGDIGTMLSAPNASGVRLARERVANFHDERIRADVVSGQTQAASSRAIEEFIETSGNLSETRVSWFRNHSSIHRSTPTYVCPEP